MNCKYSFPFCGLSFHFPRVSFGAQKFLVLMQSSLVTCSFAACAFGVIYLRIHCQIQSHEDWHISSKSFMVLPFTFGSWCSFTCGVRYTPNFTPSCGAVHLPQHHLLKRPCFFFPHWIVLASLLKISLTVSMRVYFWILHSNPLTYMSVFIPVPHCLDYCSS